MGALFTVQQTEEIQDVSRIGDGSGWRLGKTRLNNLSDNDKRRFNSQSASGFGKNIANWIGRDKAYPSNVLHLATECGNKNHSAAFLKNCPHGSLNYLQKMTTLCLTRLPEAVRRALRRLN
jgi:hypothetical protein